MRSRPKHSPCFVGQAFDSVPWRGIGIQAYLIGWDVIGPAAVAVRAIAFFLEFDSSKPYIPYSPHIQGGLLDFYFSPRLTVLPPVIESAPNPSSEASLPLKSNCFFCRWIENPRKVVARVPGRSPLAAKGHLGIVRLRSVKAGHHEERFYCWLPIALRLLGILSGEPRLA
ncbi:hypothetical protein VNO77_50420 [Canavalia gladiata]|uniref:Uncharacterized protein n=1 Tax=Canavalia gladiata TaxID=3824 RepID=A0AAN9PEP9_CANGL